MEAVLFVWKAFEGHNRIALMDTDGMGNQVLHAWLSDSRV